MLDGVYVTGFPVNTSVIYVIMDVQDWSGTIYVIQLGTVNGLKTDLDSSYENMQT